MKYETACIEVFYKKKDLLELIHGGWINIMIRSQHIIR